MKRTSRIAVVLIYIVFSLGISNLRSEIVDAGTMEAGINREFIGEDFDRENEINKAKLEITKRKLEKIKKMLKKKQIERKVKKWERLSAVLAFAAFLFFLFTPFSFYTKK